MSRGVTALAGWFGDEPANRIDALGHALSLLRDGTLSIDENGCVWRHFENFKNTRKPIVPSRRAENNTKKGYLAVTMAVPRHMRTCGHYTVRVLAHRLVWSWLNGPIPDEIQINHIDLNKKNNRPGNLELATGAQNIQHSYANGRTRPWSKATEWRPGIPRKTKEQIEAMLALIDAGHTQMEVVALTGFSRHQVQLHVKRRKELQCRDK